MGYRDDQEPLQETLSLLLAEQASTQQELAPLEARLLNHNRALLSERRWRRLPLALACMAIAVLAWIPWSTYGEVRRYVRERENRKIALDNQLQELETRRNTLNREQASAWRKSKAEIAPVASGAQPLRVFDQLRVLDATDKVDAAKIVGAVACIRGDRALAERAFRSLNETNQGELGSLCAWRFELSTAESDKEHP